MSTTIADPRSVPSGPSGKVVAGFVAAAIAVVGVGYGIVNFSEPASVNVSPSSAQVADREAETARMLAINENWADPSAAAGTDQLSTQRATEFTAPQAALAETERMLAINENWADPSASAGTDQLSTQKATEFAALQAALAKTERMLAINENWSDPSASAGADLVISGGDAAWQSRVEFLRIQHAVQAQSAQHESRIDYLTEQWNAQHPESKLGGAPKRPIVVE
jgi:hypothetical protein